MRVAGAKLQQTSIIGVGTSTNKPLSDANNYVLPDLSITLQLSPNLVTGTGLEVDSGIGTGYSYAQDVLSDKPNNTLDGLGSIPLGDTAFSVIAYDVIKLVRTTLVPIPWAHTVTPVLAIKLPAPSLLMATFNTPS